MKKLLCICFCICFLLCTGCSNFKDVKKEPLSFSGFSAVVRTELNGVTIISNVTYNSASGYKFTFTKPKTIENITISGSEGEFSLSGESLNLTLQSDKLPPSMICKALSDCVNAVSGASPISQNGTLQYAYFVDDVQCMLYTDENKNFQKITVGTQEFIFDSFSYTTGT